MLVAVAVVIRTLSFVTSRCPDFCQSPVSCSLGLAGLWSVAASGYTVVLRSVL